MTTKERELTVNSTPDVRPHTRNTPWKLLVVMAVCLAAVAAVAIVVVSRTQPGHVGSFWMAAKGGVDGEYWVELSQGDDRADVRSVGEALADEHGGAVRKVFADSSRLIMKATEAQARAMAADGRVSAVAQDTWAKPVAVQENAPTHLDRIDERVFPRDGKFDVRTGFSATPGSGTTIYVIDSGIRTTHTAFAGRATNGPDFANASTEPGFNVDCYGHGTSVAALAGANTYGVARGAKIVGLKVFRACEGRASKADIYEAVKWVTRNGEPKSVVNISIAAQVDKGAEVVEEAIRESIAAGHTYVIAAGNNSGDACLASPARVKEAITVAASSPTTDARYSQSNFGSCVDLYAPGQDITTASSLGDTAKLTASGTSFAAPQVAGAVAIEKPITSTPAKAATYIKYRATPQVITGEKNNNANFLLHVGGRYANTADVPVPDRGSASSTITVSGEADPGAAMKTVARVSYTVKHKTRGQVQVDLVAPNGKSFRLHSFSADTGDDVAQFDKPLNVSTIPPNGNWTLRVTDGFTGTTGTILGWNLLL